MPQQPAADNAAELARVDRMARLLDARFRLFGIRFGWDSIFGLFPVVGDTLVAAPSAWMIWRAHKLGLPRATLARMAGNTALDYVIGSIPVLGTIFDIGFKANLRNAELLRTGLAGPDGKRKTPGAFARGSLERDQSPQYRH